MPVDDTVASSLLLAHDPERSDTQEETTPRMARMIHELKSLQEIIGQFGGVDATEFACLKAITLFKTELSKANAKEDKNGRENEEKEEEEEREEEEREEEEEEEELMDVASIVAFQEQTRVTLSKYEAHAYPHEPFRFGKLMLMLPMLRAVSAHTIEELFFKKTIGNIAIERVILDMYKSNMAAAAAASI